MNNIKDSNQEKLINLQTLTSFVFNDIKYTY